MHDYRRIKSAMKRFREYYRMKVEIREQRVDDKNDLDHDIWYTERRNQVGRWL